MPQNSRTPPKQQRAVGTRDALLLGAASTFAKVPYSEARLRDIATESGVSSGSLFFHFGNKQDVAVAVLAAQQERMTTVLTKALAGPGKGLTKLMIVAHGLAELIASDVVVQAGIKLASQPTPDLASAAHDPYVEWVRIARALITQGVDDGSVATGIDVDAAAEFMNSAFVGTQVLSEYSDSWSSLPMRLRRLEPFLTIALRAPATT